MSLLADKEYKQMDFRTRPLPGNEFAGCLFIACNFSEADLSHKIFAECEFIECDLSMARLHGTLFRDVVFRNSKMLGLHFEDCNKIGLSFEFHACKLDHASFYQCLIKKTHFGNCSLLEVDFTESQLEESLFDTCDLSGAIFDRTELGRADLRTSFNFTINPEINNLRKARFSLTNLPGLLGKYDLQIDT